MEAIAHLMTLAAEADVFERALPQPAIDPIAEDTLIGPAKLTGACEHAAAVDEDGKVECFAVFERHRLGGELGRAVERNRRERGERFSNACRADSVRKVGCVTRTKRAVGNFNWQRGQWCNRIHATRAQQDEAGAMLFAEFEEVDRAGKIVID